MVKNDMKVLAILGHGNALQEPLYKSCGCDIFYVYKKQNIFSSVARRIMMDTPISWKYISYLFENIDLSSYDVIVLNECIFPSVILNYIRYHNEKCKMIYVYWNTVFFNIPNHIEPRMYNSRKQYELLRKCAIETKTAIVSFDKKDCSTLGFIYNGQCCVDYRNDYTCTSNKKDVFFCGQDKGRRSYLNTLVEKFDQQDITYDILLKGNKQNNSKIKYINKSLDYKDVLHKMWECRAILDIVQEGQCGITWRPIESIFYKKKLITTFSNIKEYDFYKERNVFVLGVDDPAELKRFIYDEYEDIDDGIVERYTFKSWLNRIIDKLH